MISDYIYITVYHAKYFFQRFGFPSIWGANGQWLLIAYRADGVDVALEMERN